MSAIKFSVIFMMFVLVACADHPKAKKINPASIEQSQDGGTAKLILTDQAVKRLGIVSENLRASSEVPRSSLLYDIRGGAWVYTDLGNSTYQRVEIKVSRVRGDLLEIKNRLSTATRVVIVGAAELYGTESGIGK